MFPWRPIQTKLNSNDYGRIPTLITGQSLKNYKKSLIAFGRCGHLLRVMHASGDIDLEKCINVLYSKTGIPTLRTADQTQVSSTPNLCENAAAGYMHPIAWYIDYI